MKCILKLCFNLCLRRWQRPRRKPESFNTKGTEHPKNVWQNWNMKKCECQYLTCSPVPNCKGGLNYIFWTNITTHFTLLSTTFVKTGPRKDPPPALSIYTNFVNPPLLLDPLQLGTREYSIQQYHMKKRNVWKVNI